MKGESVMARASGGVTIVSQNPPHYKYKRKCSCGWVDSNTAEIVEQSGHSRTGSYTCPKCGKHNSWEIQA